jgi:hypothetical protein
VGPEETSVRSVGGILAVAGVVVLAGGLGWALYATGALDFSTGSAAIVAVTAAGVLFVGGLTGVLMWLAFYSSSGGYDETPRFDVAAEGADARAGTDRLA